MNQTAISERDIHEAGHAAVAINLKIHFSIATSKVKYVTTPDGKPAIMPGIVSEIKVPIEKRKEARYVALAGCVAQSQFEWERFEALGIKPKFENLHLLIRERFPRFPDDNKCYFQYLDTGSKHIIDEELFAVELLAKSLWPQIKEISEALSLADEMKEDDIARIMGQH